MEIAFLDETNTVSQEKINELRTAAVCGRLFEAA